MSTHEDASGVRTPFHELLDADLNPDVEKRARALLRAWDGWQYGRSPSACAAMSVYYATRAVGPMKPTQKRIARQFGLGSYQSIRENWKRVCDELGEDEAWAVLTGEVDP